MSQECNIDSLPCDNVLHLKIMDTSHVTICSNNSDDISQQDITEQVSIFAQTQNIERLSLLGNELSSLPNNFTEHLINLIYLDLSKNQLNNLPSSLKSLKKLVYLNIECNKFSCIPDVVCEITNLNILKAGNNFIKAMPDKLLNLVNLKDLDLSANQLADLPMSYANLHSLRNLSLANNKFKKIPNCIANGMCNLQMFDLSQNLNSYFNIPPKSTELSVFHAERNNLSPLFPTWILNPMYENLVEVSFNETQFQRFDLSELSKSSIRKLSMKQCKLSDKIIEKLIAKMVHLEELIIGNTRLHNSNNFWCIPIESLKQQCRIKKIDISNTGIPEIPKAIDIFVALTAIDVSSNTIAWLPEEICSLKSLKSLLLHKNQLICLPIRMGDLVSLEELNVSHNYLCKLPDTMELLSNLQYLDLNDNQMEEVPEAIKNLPNLIGLDLEQNYFVTIDLSLDRKVCYERMRDSLRDHWYNGDKAFTGYKVKSVETLQSFSNGRSSSSSMSDSTEANFSKKGTFSIKSDTAFNNLQDEHWDSSENSADEFDPHEHKEPRQRAYSPFTFYHPPKHVFCPAESHEKRIITRISQMLRDGTFVWPTNYAEGQFDDP